MPPGAGDLADEKFPDLGAESGQLLRREGLELGGTVHLFQKRILLHPERPPF